VQLSIVVSLSIDVVIPTHDGWELTEHCLQLLARQTVAHTAIVADDGSSDGTPAAVRREFPAARVVETGANLGFSVACNRGAEAGTGEVIVLLNNDVECPVDFLERLVAPLADDARVGSAAAVLLQPQDELVDSVGLTADRTLAGFPRHHGRPVAEAGDPVPVLTGPSGAAGGYRRAAWEEVGGLDEGVFFYLEDLDLALRLRSTGWEAAAALDARAVHRGAASIGPRSARQRRQAGFSRAYFLRRYGLLRSTAAARVLLTEATVVAGDAVLERDLEALRGRIAGWREAANRPRSPAPPTEAIERSIGLRESLRLRRSAVGAP
jgi:N-acetylglucosaminyl-diphospho-decaprenol L-rhamnosyltransferase